MSLQFAWWLFIWNAFHTFPLMNLIDDQFTFSIGVKDLPALYQPHSNVYCTVICLPLKDKQNCLIVSCIMTASQYQNNSFDWRFFTVSKFHCFDFIIVVIDFFGLKCLSLTKSNLAWVHDNWCVVYLLVKPIYLKTVNILELVLPSMGRQSN